MHFICFLINITALWCNLEIAIKSDANEINSETNAIESEISEIESETTEIKSENNEIKSETTEINSEINEIKSKNTETMSEVINTNSKRIEIHLAYKKSRGKYKISLTDAVLLLINVDKK